MTSYSNRRHYTWKDYFTLVNDSHVTFYDHLVDILQLCKYCNIIRATKIFTTWDYWSLIVLILYDLHQNRIATALSIPPAHSLEMNSLLAVLMQRHFRTSRTSLMGVQKSSWKSMKQHVKTWKSMEEYAWEMKTHLICVVALYVWILSLESLAISTLLFLTNSTSTSTSSLFPSTPTPSYTIPSTSSKTRYTNKH